MHQRAKVRALLLCAERNPQNSALQQGEQRIGLTPLSLQQKGGFCENRFARKQRRTIQFPLLAPTNGA